MERLDKMTKFHFTFICVFFFFGGKNKDDLGMTVVSDGREDFLFMLYLGRIHAARFQKQAACVYGTLNQADEVDCEEI